jgi:hypothetical protein
MFMKAGAMATTDRSATAQPQERTRERATRDEDWSTEPVKVTLSLPAGCVENIKWLAKRLSIPNSHVVRRAVDLRYRIQKELDAGATILIQRDGQPTQMIWFD